jgi:hypothetical protein
MAVLGIQFLAQWRWVVATGEGLHRHLPGEISPKAGIVVGRETTNKEECVRMVGIIT